MEEKLDCVAGKENTEIAEEPAVQAAVAEAVTEEKTEQVKKTPADEKPPKGSRYELISLGGWIGILLLLAIPVVGPVLLIVWALGGCRKQQKRNFARAQLILSVVSLILTVALVFAAVRAAQSAVEKLEKQLEEQFNVSSIEEAGKLVEGIVTGNFTEGSEEILKSVVDSYMGTEESQEMIKNVVISYIGSDVELTEEEQEQLDEVIGGLASGEITFSKEDINALMEQLGK